MECLGRLNLRPVLGMRIRADVSEFSPSIGRDSDECDRRIRVTDCSALHQAAVPDNSATQAP